MAGFWSVTLGTPPKPPWRRSAGLRKAVVLTGGPTGWIRPTADTQQSGIALGLEIGGLAKSQISDVKRVSTRPLCRWSSPSQSRVTDSIDNRTATKAIQPRSTLGIWPEKLRSWLVLIPVRSVRPLQGLGQFPSRSGLESCSFSQALLFFQAHSPCSAPKSSRRSASLLSSMKRVVICSQGSA